jgi:hypothetical protein
MSRTLSASDRKALIKMAGSLPVGSPERKALLMGLAKAPVVHRTRKFARAKLNDFERTHIKAMRDHLDRVERLIERVTLNDASDALNDMEKVESAVDQFEGQGYTAKDDLYFWNDIPEDIEDSAFNLQQAVESAIHDIKQMIDAGMADGGYEDAVMERMENEIMPQIEDAVADHADLLKSYR